MSALQSHAQIRGLAHTCIGDARVGPSTLTLRKERGPRVARRACPTATSSWRTRCWTAWRPGTSRSSSCAVRTYARRPPATAPGTQGLSLRAVNVPCVTVHRLEVAGRSVAVPWVTGQEALLQCSCYVAHGLRKPQNMPHSEPDWRAVRR